MNHIQILLLIVCPPIMVLYCWAILSYKKTILYREFLDREELLRRVNQGELVEVELTKIPYLIRYTLLSCKLFTIKIHKALISDPDEPHDHPWNYLSVILWGGYWEEQIISYTEIIAGTYIAIKRNKITTKFYKPGSILYRKGDKLHKLIISPNKYCISLIFTFKRWRKWGYLKEGIWNQYHIQ